MMSLPPRRVRALILALCAFVLFAQHAALTHLVWHAAAQSTQEHEADAHEREGAPLPSLASACAFDTAFAQVLGGSLTPHPSVFWDTGVSQAALHSAPTYLAADALTARSRGPPAIL